ncbi:putative metalloprotease CJM1_0395 family protein [Aquitalea sp. ASV15]|uniref:putative metalloprotease CJM1_0395 family protein n=1 Tax=Aquitalea sp. ASV15 TaxID=2795104 RepID=UPI0018EC232C|nr:putative metalloprotease CJM1_0395 family protein [Aquitalea sp. ASV15]
MSISSLSASTGYPISSGLQHGPACNCPSCTAARMASIATPVAGVTPPSPSAIYSGKPLSPDQQKQLDELRARDADVRQHEQAHMAAGGALVSGGANYSYQEGPDGKQYAIGGEVSIRLSSGQSPQETLSNAKQVAAAALAPTDPSGQDRAVAAEAEQMAQQAQSEIDKQQQQQVQQAQHNPAIDTAKAIFAAIAHPQPSSKGNAVDTFA